MKYEIAMKWVEALRSGNYKQGRYYLKNSSDEFCCLGVLCNISKISKWDGNNYENEVIWIPNKVVQWAGMNSCSGYIDISKNYYRNLSNYNDNGMTFEEIADIIEKHWETL